MSTTNQVPVPVEDASTAPAKALSIKEMDRRKKRYRKIESRLLVVFAFAGLSAALISAVVLESSTPRTRALYAVLGLVGGAVACFLVHFIMNGARYNLEGEWHRFVGTPDTVGTTDTIHTFNSIESKRVKKSILVTFTSSAHAHIFPYEQWVYDALWNAKKRKGPLQIERRRTNKAEYEARASS